MGDGRTGVERDSLFRHALAPVIMLGPTLSSVWATLYGCSRETTVLNAFLVHGRLSLSALARACGASERAVRRADRCGGGAGTGWLRGILDRYRDAGLLIEKDRGNSITYELNDASPTVALLRELRVMQREPGHNLL